MVFHALNRGNGRMEIFEDEADYAAFERVMQREIERSGMRLLAYCLMPNHWHLVLWPRGDGDMGRFMQRLTTTHVRRWHEHRQTVGYGHLYQGTYKSFPVATDEHLLALCRYVERNALRANLVDRAQAWRWCSLWRRRHPKVVDEVPALSRWPVDVPRDWVRRVNRAQSDREVEAIQRSIQRGRPFGSPHWQTRIARQLDMTHTLRPRGRPRKKKK